MRAYAIGVQWVTMLCSIARRYDTGSYKHSSVSRMSGRYMF